MVARNSPEGIPAGWTANCKVLSSGRKLKYYTDLKTGKKCYSKQEVYRYNKYNGGKAIKARTSSGNLSNGSINENLHGTQRVNTHLGWLPKGWLTEFRQYEAGPKIGKAYKIYIEESTGHKCYSKPEVLRYLKKQKKGRMIREIKKATVTSSKSKTPTAKVQKPSTEATRPEKAAGGGSYVTRSLSMSDGHVNSVQTRGSKRRQQSDLNNSCTSTSPDIVLKADNTLYGEFEMHCGNTTSINRGSSAPPRRFSKRLARLEPETATNSSSNDHFLPPTAKRSARDQKTLALIKVDNMDVRDTGYESPPVTEVDPILKEENTVSIRKKSSNSSHNTENKRESHLSRRFSNRLAGLEPKLGDIEDFSGKSVRGVGKRSCTDQTLSVSASVLTSVVLQACQQSNVHRGLLDKSNSERGLEFHQSNSLGGNAAGNNESKTGQEMKSGETHCHSKRLGGNEPEVILDSAGEAKSKLPNQFILPETVGSSKDQETSQQKPIWHSWSDPCLEFAFKTLTGEISIEDDLQIQTYFQQIKKPVQKDGDANGSLVTPDFLPMDAAQKSFSREQPRVEPPSSQQANAGGTITGERTR
ncbi:unnamed protein product [Rhodiola kirilowii]